MNIVLPDPFASKYDYDFKLYNEIKMMVRDPKEKITREDSKKLQMILDEHLRANGIEYFLEEAIDITDYKKFQEALTREGKHNPLDKAKAIIKANEEENPELALELSELLEKKLIDAKIDRKQAVIDLFSDMEEIINRHKNRYSSVGLSDEKHLVVYDIVKNMSEEADKLTLEIFDTLEEELRTPAILVQSDAQKEMRNSIKPLLTKYGVDRKMSKDIIAKLVDTFSKVSYQPKEAENIMVILERKHIDKFNKKPNIIGMFWNDPEALIDGIEEAIEKNKPYDEYELFSDEEKKAWDNGEILF